MIRKYHLYHLDDLTKAQELCHAVEELEGIRSVYITGDLKEMDIDAKEERFSQIMDRTVNICRRLSDTCEITYMF